MKRITISDDHFRKLKTLAKEYYAIKGEKAMPLTEVVQKMIDREYRNYDPPVYQTTGFDRQ